MASPVEEQSNELNYSNITTETLNQEDCQNQENISVPEMEVNDTDQVLDGQQKCDDSQPLTSEFHHHAVEEGAPSAGSAFHVMSQTNGQKDKLTNEQPPNSESEANELSEMASLNSDGSRSFEGQHKDDPKIGGKLFSAHVIEQHIHDSEGICLDMLNEPKDMQELPMSTGEEDALLSMSEEKTDDVEDMLVDDIDAAEKELQSLEAEDSVSKVQSKHLSEDLKRSEVSELNPIEDFQFLKPTIIENSNKDSSIVNNSVDNDVENELVKQHTSLLHKPEAVFNIDEETRMGLDQTPVDSAMIEDASFIYPTLPPKKLFHLEDTKDSEASDTDTKMSATCDTEDIRLRNTISIDDTTKDSAASDSNAETPTPSRKQRRASREGLGISLLEGIEAGERIFTADDLFEYQWPQDGGEWHMLQEQISEYLKVKSFKRKYPDLYRRTCDKEEKDFLRDKGVVTETQSDLGLTALRSEEVYDLMMKDYNSKYKDYIAHLQEKQKKVIREKHKEYSCQAKLDKSKIETYSKKAARSAAEFNASLMRDKKEERRAYFDLQTYTIHFPKNKFRTLPPEYTKVGAYPVALIPGQYQENFRKYSAEELKYYPLKTSTRDPPKVVKYVRPPPPGAKLPISDKQKTSANSEDEDSDSSAREDNDNGSDNIENGENDDKENDNVQAEGLEMLTPVKLEKRIKGTLKRKSLKLGTPERQKKIGKKSKDVEVEVSAEKTTQDTEEKGGSPDFKKMPGKIHGLEKCRICKKRSTKEERKAERLVKCAECGKIGHMGCLDLTEELVAVIKTYPWQCMECKTCVECLDPFDEDKMMFCDRCDRGYHTFCIGLNALPTGHWECKSCEGSPKIPQKLKPVRVERGHPGRPRKIPLVIPPEPYPPVKVEPDKTVKKEEDVKQTDAPASTEGQQGQQLANQPVKGEKEASGTENNGAGSSEATETPVKVGHKRRKLSATPVTPKSVEKLTPKSVPSKQDEKLTPKPVPSKQDEKLTPKSVPSKQDEKLTPKSVPSKQDEKLTPKSVPSKQDEKLTPKSVPSKQDEKLTPKSVPSKQDEKMTPKSVPSKQDEKLTPKPVPSKQDRIQGARQSRRLKIKVEEEEERRKMDDGDKSSKKKRKKKNSKVTEDAEKDSCKEGVKGSEKKALKTETSIVPDETPPDGLGEVVSEEADDSCVDIFDKSDIENKEMEVTDSPTNEGNVEAQEGSVDQEGGAPAQKVEEVQDCISVSANNVSEMCLEGENIPESEIKPGSVENSDDPSFSLALADSPQSEALSQEAESAVNALAPTVLGDLQETAYSPLAASQNIVDFQTFSDAAISGEDWQSQTELELLSQPDPPSLLVEDLIPPLPESLPGQDVLSESYTFEAQPLLVVPSQDPSLQDVLTETVLPPLQQSFPLAADQHLDSSIQDKEPQQLPDGQSLNPESLAVCTGDLSLAQLVADACSPGESGLKDSALQEGRSDGGELIDNLLGAEAAPL